MGFMCFNHTCPVSPAEGTAVRNGEEGIGQQLQLVEPWQSKARAVRVGQALHKGHQAMELQGS